MHHTFSLVCLLFLLVTNTKSLVAQADTYSLDNPLKYRLEIDAEAVLDSPAETVRLKTKQDGEILLTAITRDTVFASYTSLSLEYDGPEGYSNPNTTAALNQMFMLHFPETGTVKTIMAPSFPKVVSDIANLHHTFFDFFLPLPDEKLAMNSVWTAEARETTLKGQNLHRIGSYKVVGDSLIGETKVWVVDAVIDANLSWDTRDRARGVDISVQLSGQDYSRFYFSSASKQMIGRDSSAELAGTLNYSGGKKLVVVKQSQRADGKIRLIR